MIKRKYLSVIFSGILFSIPFIFPDFNILSFFAGIPFFIVLFDELKNRKKNKAVKYTFVFAMSFYIPVFIWFLWMYPMEQTGITPLQSVFIVVAAWLGFPLLQTFVMLILPLGLKIFRKIYTREKINLFFLPALTAALYVIAEWVQSWFATGLTWAKLSLSQYKNIFFIQSISLFGTYFTSFIIIFINASIALYILNRHYKSVPVNKNNLLFFSVILLYFLNSYFGFFRVMYYDYTDRAGDKETITAQIMQGNISSYEKWEVSGVENSLKIYSSLVEDNNSEKIDICVFPETAIPVEISEGSDTYNIIYDLAKQNNITLITGIFYNNYPEDKRYNAIMAFDKNHGFIKPYGKRHLVPFGEYMPFENILMNIFPFVAELSLFNSVLTQGEDANIMTVNGINYGGLVCFDSIFPELARKSTKEGADILIIVTNDSWFRDSPAIYQHNAQAVLRAVENNRYVIRSANTGISSFISPTGRILQQSVVFERTVLTEEIGVIKNKTVYTLCGDIILYLAWGYIGFCMGLLFIQNKNLGDC